MAKSWFITGTSRGFGRVWAEAALERGDRVVATARRIESLADLSERYGDRVVVLPLDVTSKVAVDRAVEEALRVLGRLDVVVNNAGYGLFGTVEEVSEEEARAQFETNFFGALWVTKAVLPVLRAQGAGHILQVSSIGGVTSFQNVGLYNASKWALEGMSQALATELAPFGVKVTLIEPAAYSTDWRDSSAVRAEPIKAYDFVRDVWSAASGAQRGDPASTAKAVMAIVDAEDPPLRLFLGKAPLTMIRKEYADRLAIWEAWDEVAREAHGS